MERDLLTIDLFEKDTLSSDDHIGHCTIEVSVFCHGDILEWFPLNYMDKRGKEQSAGKIKFNALWKPLVVEVDEPEPIAEVTVEEQVAEVIVEEKVVAETMEDEVPASVERNDDASHSQEEAERKEAIRIEQEA